MMKTALGFLRKYSGQIAYYACIALVLTAVAVAAERLRPDGEAQETLVLPAVELTMPESVKAGPLFEIPDGMLEMRGYAGQPEWNSAHGQWETHAATDFSCAGGIVRSLSEGTVKTIGKSGIYGGFVEIALDEFLLRYASVEPDEGLLVGDSVGKGDVLGIVNDSMPGEAYMQEHLHLELESNGVCLDFAKEREKS